MNYSVIVLAAGKGIRAGLGYNKVLYYMDKHETTILGKTLEFFIEDERCKQIILVCSKDDYESITKDYIGEKIQHVLGGARRQDSVYNGLQVVNQEVVLIHDGNRPFIDNQIIDRILNALKNEDAVLVAIQSKEIIKQVKGDYVIETLDRNILRNAQTPQAFKTKTIIEAHNEINKLKLDITDDSQAVEIVGNAKIKVVEGSLDNEKITWSEDLENL